MSCLVAECFLIVLVGSVWSQNCPTFPNPVISDLYRTPSLRFPLFTQDAEIVTLQNGSPKDLIKLDSSVFADPSKTLVYQTSYRSGGYYSVNMSYFPINTSDYFVICINLNVVQGEKPLQCRVCQLASLECIACPFVLYSHQVKTFRDGTGQIESTFSDVQIPMTVEYVVSGRESMMSFGPNDYYYGTTPNPSNNCARDVDTLVLPKTKVFKYALMITPMNNLKQNYDYNVQMKFEIIWNGTVPFNWSNPLPVTVDSSFSTSFSVGRLCPK